MPDDTGNSLRLLYDERDHQTLKLAAVIAGAPNLRTWATRTLLDHARQIVTAFQTHDQSSSPPPPEGAGL